MVFSGGMDVVFKITQAREEEKTTSSKYRKGKMNLEEFNLALIKWHERISRELFENIFPQNPKSESIAEEKKPSKYVGIKIRGAGFWIWFEREKTAETPARWKRRDCRYE
jgi:hypothetical protein